ncbi:Abi family protein [Leifsonia sp. F6_8S_P_1B]|uniref:Abi family protein n=1 Tax=Leifsonia williamsii TaxID=3035919 RepID=A0ABT8KFK8_9MICO|nr:Abi family protein [Leifsonia williamsii]MDN4616236.1 Abi family protein [Leifsonia williamsii]
MQYGKPHLTLDEQMAQLAARGLRIDDSPSARRVLETVGYYRFSAYAYPFRQPLAVGVVPETSVQFRADTFVEGAAFGWAQQLWGFDRALRLLILDAVETVEIALRAKVSFHLGHRDAFGHLSRASLDPAKCDRPDAEHPGSSSYDVWRDRFVQHQERAVSEDFIRHYVEKYDARLPVWVATEVMELGQLVRLFGFMTDGDQSLVSKDMAGVSGAVFARWLKVINYVRNLCAHHARLWNRRLTYKLGRIPENAPGLLHLNAIPNSRERIYAVCAVVCFLTDAIRAEDAWGRRLAALIDRFPGSLPVAPETDMGFPDGWRPLPLWSR